MARLLTFILASLACSGTPMVSAYDTFVRDTVSLAYDRPADDSNSSTCVGVKLQFTHPPNEVHISQMLAINVTAVDLPANTLVMFSTYHGPATVFETVNASDPSTWFVALYGPSVTISIKQDPTSVPLDCSHRTMSFEYSLLSDYCKRSNTPSLCGAGANSTNPTVAPSSAATSLTAAVWSVAVSAIAVFASTR